MASPFNNVSSKLSRAICFYLISAGVDPIGGVNPIYTEDTSTYPNIKVIPQLLRPDPHYSGNYRGAVAVSIKGSVAGAQNQTAQAAREAFDTLCASTLDALSLSSDSGGDWQATANLINTAAYAQAVASPTTDSDLADFTMLQWIDGGFGPGKADAEGCSWEVVLMFEALCCGSNVN